MMPIDGATRAAAEQLLAPYIGKEHAKCGLVVCEPCLNRAYVDLTVCLTECLDPNVGRKKRA